MKRNNGKQYENNGEEMKTHCLPRLMHAGKCACQLHLPLFSRLLLLPRRVSSLSLTPHFPPIAPPHRRFPSGLRIAHSTSICSRHPNLNF